MANASNQSTSLWFDGIVVVRIALGLLLLFHGWQLFENRDMDGFADLLFNMSIPFPEAMAYTGKLVELAGGFFLILGLFTRPITVLLLLNYLFITFVMGKGDIFAADQHPFLLALFSLLFFFTGAGRISVDYILFINRKEDNHDGGVPINKRFGRYVSRG